jgi:hypothetical protein
MDGHPGEFVSGVISSRPYADFFETAWCDLGELLSPAKAGWGVLTHL